MDVKQPEKCQELLEGITSCHILMISKLYLEKLKKKSEETTLFPQKAQIHLQ